MEIERKWNEKRERENDREKETDRETEKNRKNLWVNLRGIKKGWK